MPKRKAAEGSEESTKFAPGSEPTLRIRCKVTDSVSIEELNDLQDDFKFMSLENQAKLKKEMETVGFCEPISVWFNKGKYFVLNGHQRINVIKTMIADGWVVPDGTLPVNVVEADDKKEAKRLVMGLTSNYGTVSKKGYKRLLKEAGMSEDEGQSAFNFPDLVVADKAPAKKKKVEFTASDGEKLVTCPKCGAEFDPKDDAEEGEAEEGAEV